MIPATLGKSISLPVHRSTRAGAVSTAVGTLSPRCIALNGSTGGARLASTALIRAAVKPQSVVVASSKALIHHPSVMPANNNNNIIMAASRRHISSSERRPSTLAQEHSPAMPPPFEAARAGPLSVLPLIMILRSLATNTVSSSPLLLPPSLRIMSVLANTANPLLSPDRNPLLRWFMKQTFYAQFCAGEGAAEVQRTIRNLKGIGFNGVMLCYAKEVVLTKEQLAAAPKDQGQETEECIRDEIAPWAEGTLETVRMATEGDYVALKFTGAGRLALYQLQNRLPCSPFLADSIDAICQLAQERGIRLLFDAEQDALQDGIDDWTMRYARQYNKDPKNPVIFGTYQAYKKCMPRVISDHLAQAQKEGFSLGVKLVRGAYLGSDPRHLLHDTQQDTDDCFNGIAAGVLTRQWNSSVSGEGAFPPASIVLATHNAESVRRARAICDAGAARSPVAFAQLQGMADEVSCELVEACNQSRTKDGSDDAATSFLPTYKYLVWGSTGECMKYLLRRAQENKDAVQRTRSSRDAMWAELKRRVLVALGVVA